jgi:hypothetical protein
MAEQKKYGYFEFAVLSALLLGACILMKDVKVPFMPVFMTG